MIKIDKATKEALLDLYKSKKIALEGNILKVIDSDGDEEFDTYVKDSIEKDKENRRKRLDITKQIQNKNKELLEGEIEKERVNLELVAALEEAEKSKKEAICAKEQAELAKEEAETAREEAEDARSEAEKSKIEAINAKNLAEGDLELMQKRTQFELIGTIVKVALWVILGVGVITTLVFMIALFAGKDTAVIGSTWSNIIGILLTNSFSIIGTIMGVKYASSDKKE
jgi:flagellar biosynthesis GTPase FlhF